MFKRTFFFLFFLSLILFSCSSSSDLSRIKKNVLCINFQSDPPTLDPRKGNSLSCSNFLIMLFEGLTRNPIESRAELAIAQKVDISPDGKIYTFHLRDAKWSDGSELEAGDFEFAWKESLKPDFPSYRSELFYPIKNAKSAKKGVVSVSEVGVAAIDTKTLVVELEHPAPYFLELVASTSFLPVPHRHVLNHPDWADPNSSHFICNGPFSLDRWEFKRYIQLKKNKHYWSACTVSLSEINISLVPDETTALDMYKKGELDLLGYPFTHIPLDSIPALIEQKQIHSSPVSITRKCIFNTTRFPFHNRHIRKAFAYSINRQEIVDHLTKCGEIVATGMVPPILKNHVCYKYHLDADFAAAQEHLRKGLEELNIDLSELEDLTLTYVSVETSRVIAQVLQQQWKKVLGIEVRLENTDLPIHFDKLERKDYDLAYSGMAPFYQDSMGFLYLFKYKKIKCNFPGWESSDYIQLLEASDRCRDPKKREEILEKAEQMLVDEQITAPIYFDTANFMQKPYLKGVYVSSKGLLHLDKAYFEQR